MQVVSGLLHPLRQLHGRSGLVFNPKGDFAVRVHIEKLRPGVLEHRADFSGDLVHGQLADLQMCIRDSSRVEAAKVKSGLRMPKEHSASTLSANNS